jgi:hypothetical protein
MLVDRLVGRAARDGATKGSCSGGDGEDGVAEPLARVDAGGPLEVVALAGVCAS